MASKAVYQMSVDDAVAWLLRQESLDYRRRCLYHWRDRFGDAYADQVQRLFAAAWAKRRNGR